MNKDWFNDLILQHLFYKNYLFIIVSQLVKD